MQKWIELGKMPIIPTYGVGCDIYLKAHGVTGFTLLGQRVPLLIISPYSKEG
jgi:phospholipase C